jgi:hypothetical protein
MPNITLSMDEDLLKAGRQYAQEHNTSLNALIRELLAGKVQGRSAYKLEEMFRLMDSSKGNSKGWKWNRDEIYDA